MKKSTTPQRGESPSRLIDARIAELADWRGRTLGQVRRLIKEAAPGVAEAWKWRGVPVWELNGMICTGETYQTHVKLTFFNGAELEDPGRLFNAGLESKSRRSIDFHEGDRIDEASFKALIREVVARNAAAATRRRARKA